jgi:acyl carrier protein
MTERIRRVVAEFAGIGAAADEITDTTDLYAAGMTSHASVNLMLALESEFDVEFPDRMLRRAVFESVAAIRDAIEELTREAAA